MNEQVVVVANPRDFYGPNNTWIDHLNGLFTGLKVVVRGARIKVSGDDAAVVDRYVQRVGALQDYLGKYGHISCEVIDRMCDGVGSLSVSSSPYTSTYNHSFGSSSAGSSANSSDRSVSGDIEGADAEHVIVYGNGGNVVRARTKHQQKLVAQYQVCDLLFAVGPAGSGKTYTAIALAVRALRDKQVKRIVLTRPAVEAGERLGFLPGDMKEKLDPYLQPLYDALGDMIPAKKLSQMMEEGVVQIAPLAYMRGRTLDNAFVILDEAQNTTNEQLKMFLTRMGRTAKFIVTGDLTQIDLPNRRDSGLGQAIERLRKIKGIAVVEFDGRDILRHPLVGKIVEAYADDDAR